MRSSEAFAAFMGRLRRRDVLVPLLYALGGALWIAGSDFVLARAFGPDARALAWASTFKGLCFIAVTAIILRLALRSAEERRVSADGHASARPRFALLFATGVMLLLAVALALYLVHARKELQQADGLLHLEAATAATLVEHELEQRHIHAVAIATSPFTGPAAARWQRDRDPATESRLVRRLEAIARERGSLATALLDRQGEAELVWGDLGAGPASPELVRAAAATGEVQVGRVQQARTGLPYVDTVVPLDPSGEAAVRPVLLVRDPVTAFVEPLAALPRGDDGPVVLRVVDGSDRSRVLASLGATGGGAHAADAMIAATRVPVLALLTGEGMLRAESSIPAIGWTVVALEPVEAIIGPLRRALLAGAAVTLAVASMLAVALHLLWSRAAARLTERARHWERRADTLLTHFAMANRHANDIVLLIDSQQRIVEVNPVAVEAYGCSREELVGANLADLRGDDPVERARVPEQFAAALAGSTRFETVHRRRDGSRFPVEVSSRRFESDGHTYVQSIVRDISARKHAENALLESEERFRSTFEQAAVGIAHVAPDGAWLRVNGKLCHILGYEREELLARTFQDVTFPDDLDEDLGQVQGMLAGRIQNYSMQKRYIRKDRRVVWARLSVSLVRTPGGQPDYFISVVEDISDQRAQEAAIRRLADDRAGLVERLQRQFSGMPFGCAVMDARMRVIDVNPAFERIFGWTRDEILAAEDALGLIVPPDVRRDLDPDLADAAATGSSVYRINENMTRDGRRITCSWTNVPLNPRKGVSGGMFAMCEDISERLATDRELREREARFRALADLAPVGVFRAMSDGRLVYSNPALARISGLSAGAAADYGWLAALHPEDRARARDTWAPLQRGQAVPPEETRYLHADGSVKWGQVQTAPVMDENGRVIEFVGTVTDITPFKEIERTLSERIEARTVELRLAKERAEQADRVKTGFLATMSHELRTPLNSIVGFTSVLLERLAGPLNEKQDRQLRVIQDSSRHLLALINDLLDISRIEANQLKVDSTPVDPTEVLERVMDRFRLQATEKGLGFELQMKTGLAPLMTDERRLEQIVSNLVSNAVKYTEAGQVDIDARVSGNSFELAVRDTGLGIREEDLQRLFVPFTQFKPRDGRLREGTGLGLAISWRLARALGGDLVAQSRFGEGSTFTLRIPVGT